MPGSPFQRLIGEPAILREVQAAMADTGVRVLDLEIIRIDAGFDARRLMPLFELGATLGARSVTVAGDDLDAARLCDSYARVCEAMAPYGLTADLEFTPWTAVPDARTALQVVQRAGTPANAGILPDPLHFARSRTTVEDLRAIRAACCTTRRSATASPACTSRPSSSSTARAASACSPARVASTCAASSTPCRRTCR